MTSTRELILKTLLGNPRATINEIAETVDINPISVRHHLTSLQAEGSVGAEEERHGVGRPRLVYFLTDKGQEKFPTRYMHLTARLLDQMKDKLPPAVVNEMFTEIASSMAEDYDSQIEGLDLEGRLELVKKLLAHEGFTVEWEKSGDGYRINEISCPYYQIGQRHPEVCAVDQALISRLLRIPAEKVQCILAGDKHCSYQINQTSIEEENA